jgi:hypothetical protein
LQLPIDDKITVMIFYLFLSPLSILLNFPLICVTIFLYFKATLCFTNLIWVASLPPINMEYGGVAGYHTLYMRNKNMFCSYFLKETYGNYTSFEVKIGDVTSLINTFSKFSVCCEKFTHGILQI